MTQQLLSYIQVALSVVLIILVLIQYSEAGAGSAFGGGDSFGSGLHTRRGAEKTIFYTTILFGLLFVATSFAQLIIR